MISHLNLRINHDCDWTWLLATMLMFQINEMPKPPTLFMVPSYKVFTVLCTAKNNLIIKYHFLNEGTNKSEQNILYFCKRNEYCGVWLVIYISFITNGVYNQYILLQQVHKQLYCGEECNWRLTICLKRRYFNTEKEDLSACKREPEARYVQIQPLCSQIHVQEATYRQPIRVGYFKKKKLIMSNSSVENWQVTEPACLYCLYEDRKHTKWFLKRTGVKLPTFCVKSCLNTLQMSILSLHGSHRLQCLTGHYTVPDTHTVPNSDLK